MVSIVRLFDYYSVWIFVLQNKSYNRLGIFFKIVVIFTHNCSRNVHPFLYSKINIDCCSPWFNFKQDTFVPGPFIFNLNEINELKQFLKSNLDFQIFPTCMPMQLQKEFEPIVKKRVGIYSRDHVMKYYNEFWKKHTTMTFDIIYHTTYSWSY